MCNRTHSHSYLLKTLRSKIDIPNHKNSFSVRLCKKCSRVFVSVYANGVGTGIYFYDDFPTYGLFRTLCPECSDDE